jgi:hypothetical protein
MKLIRKENLEKPPAFLVLPTSSNWKQSLTVIEEWLFLEICVRMKNIKRGMQIFRGFEILCHTASSLDIWYNNFINSKAHVWFGYVVTEHFLCPNTRREFYEVSNYRSCWTCNELPQKQTCRKYFYQGGLPQKHTYTSIKTIAYVICIE